MIALLAPHRSATTSSGYSGSSSDYCKTGSVYVRFYQAPSSPSCLKILRNSMKLQDTHVKAVSGWPRTPPVQENPHRKLRQLAACKTLASQRACDAAVAGADTSFPLDSSSSAGHRDSSGAQASPAEQTRRTQSLRARPELLSWHCFLQPPTAVAVKRARAVRNRTRSPASHRG